MTAEQVWSGLDSEVAGDSTWGLPPEPVVTLNLKGFRALMIVVGAVDGSNASTLRRRLDQAIAAGARQVVLDLAQLDFIDAAGVRMLRTFSSRLRVLGGDLVIVSASPVLHEVVAGLGLDGDLTIDRRFAC